MPWVSLFGALGTLVLAGVVAVLVYHARAGNAPVPTPTVPSIPTAAPTLARRIDGIPCNNVNISYHVHAHLEIDYGGKDVAVPANIGIDDNTCAYYLHTHDNSGEIHIEAPVVRKFTLGNFFDIWGQQLSRRRIGSIPMRKGQLVRTFVDGKVFAGDPRSIELRAHRLIALEIGPPFVRPSGFDFQGE